MKAKVFLIFRSLSWYHVHELRKGIQILAKLLLSFRIIIFNMMKRLLIPLTIKFIPNLIDVDIHWFLLKMKFTLFNFDFIKIECYFIASETSVLIKNKKYYFNSFQTNLYKHSWQILEYSFYFIIKSGSSKCCHIINPQKFF